MEEGLMFRDEIRRCKPTSPTHKTRKAVSTKKLQSFKQRRLKQQLMFEHQQQPKARAQKRPRVEPVMNIEDTRKALEEERDNCEHQILVLAGAAYLAESQQSKMVTQGPCGLCARDFGSDEERAVALQRMESTVRSYQGFVFESEFVRRRDLCFAALSKLTGEDLEVLRATRKRSIEWCTHEVKRGRISALREQKLMSIRCSACVSCGRGLNVDDVPGFLKSVDGQAWTMDRELHVHSAPL
jgi:hypothetical protein